MTRSQDALLSPLRIMATLVVVAPWLQDSDGLHGSVEVDETGAPAQGRYLGAARIDRRWHTFRTLPP